MTFFNSSYILYVTKNTHKKGNEEMSLETAHYLTFTSPEYEVVSVGGIRTPIVLGIQEGDTVQFSIGNEEVIPVAGKKEYIGNRMHIYHNGVYKTTVYGYEIGRVLESYVLKPKSDEPIAI